MSKWTRFAAIAACVVLGLGGAVFMVVRSKVDPEKLRATIETEAGKVLGRTVKVGSVSASWGLAVAIRDLTIMDAEGKQPQVTLAFARVSVALAPILKGEVKLSSLTLDGLSVSAVRNADGSLDSADVLAKVGGGTAGAGQAGTGEPVNVSISGLKIDYTDLTGTMPRRLRLSDVGGSISSGEEIVIGLAGKLEAPAEKGGKDAQDMLLASRVTLNVEYRLKANEGKITVAGREVALERVRAAVPLLQAAPVAPSGTVDASVTVALAGGKPQLTAASATLKDVQLAGSVALSGVNGEISYQGSGVDVSGLALQAGALHVVVPRGTVNVKPGGLAADQVNLLLNDMPVQASLSLAGWPASPQFTLRVAAPDADLSKLAAGATGRVRVDVTISGSPAHPAATGTVALLAPARVQLPEYAGGLAVQVGGGTLTLNGQDVSTSDVSCTVLGMTCKPRLAVSSLFSGATVAFDSGPLTVDLSKLPEMLTGEVATRAKAAAPKGTVRLSLRATGPAASPRLSGVIEPDGVSFQVPGTERRVTLSRGKVDIAGSRAVLSGLSLVHEGVTVAVSGGVEGLTGTPRVSLDVTGRNLQVAALAALAPPSLAPQLEPLKASGQVDVEALVAGTAATLRGDARVILHGLSMTAPVGERKVPVTLNSGAIEISPGVIALRGVEGVVEGMPVQLGGTVRDYTGDAALDLVAIARGLSMERLKGLMPAEALAQIQKRQIQVAFDAKASVKGTKSAPQVSMRVLPTAGTVPLPVPGHPLVATLQPGGEVGLEGKTVIITGLPLTVAGNTVKVTGTVKDPQGEGALDLKIDGQGVNLNGLGPLLPESARRMLAQSLFHGAKGIRASVGGTIAAPQIEAVVDLAGGAFNQLGPLGAGTIPRGALKLTPGGLVIQDLSMVVGGAPLDVSGKINMTNPPTLAIAVRGDFINVENVAGGMQLPAGVMFEGSTKLDIKIEGTAAEPKVNGRITLAGLGVRLPVLGKLVGESGEITLAGEDVTIADASFAAGATRVTAKGRIVRYMHDAVCEGLAVTGPLDLANVAAMTRLPLAGKGTISARMTGPIREAAIEGSLSVPSGRYGTVPLRELAADFSRSANQLKIGRLTGLVAGGRLNGSLSANPATMQSVFQFQLGGADLEQMAPKGGSAAMTGRADIAFNGTTAAGGIGTLNGNGQAKVQQLVVDLSRNAQLASYRQTAGLAGLAGSFFHGDVVDAKKAELQFYSTVLGEAQAAHDLGTMTAPIAAQHGVLRIEPIQSPKISGRIAVTLGTGQIAGRIDKLQLGRAALVIDLGGTMTAPATGIDRNQITLDGKHFSETLPKPDPAAAHQQPKSVKDALVQGLLGGGEDAAAQPADPAAAPAQPQSTRRKLGNALLNALTRDDSADAQPAAPASAPAPADPAASPPPKKKKNLLGNLLDAIK